MTIPTIATVTQLRDHLKLPQPVVESPSVTAPDERDLQLKLDAATQLICEYIADRHPEDDAWIAEIESWGIGSPATAAPPVILLAVLEQAADFYRFRGDDDQEPSREAWCLHPRIETLLGRYKNRAFA